MMTMTWSESRAEENAEPAGESKQYLYRGFMKFFYVREPVIAPENSEASD